jgi:hypothetical protein
MEKRQDDRDSKKSHGQATEDPREANKAGDEQGQQAAELQVGEERERENLSRFEPDPKAQRQYPDPKEAHVDRTPPLKEDAVDEP